MAAMESGSAWGISAITKYGWIKFAALGAALAGALMMAAFRPPKTRRELFIQAGVALGCSFLFGSFIADAILYKFQLVDVNSFEAFLNFQMAVHGMTGALSWGVFGGLAALRDKVSKDPIGTIKDVKDII
jgi:hypothetical protein